VDDPPPAALGHLVDKLLGDQEHAVEIYIQDRVLHLLGHLLERFIARDAGIVISTWPKSRMISACIFSTSATSAILWA
jgi:hypothetical protein